MSDAPAISLTGVQLAQKQLEVKAQNIAASQDENASMKQLTHGSRVINGKGIGVYVNRIERVADEAKLEVYREKTSSFHNCSTFADLTQDLTTLFGSLKEDGSSLYSTFSAVNQALTELVTRVDQPAGRAQVIERFKDFTRVLNDLANGVQSLRQLSDQNIQAPVQEINNLLERLDRVNGDIGRADRVGGTKANFLDRRDQLLRELSTYIDVRVNYRTDGTVEVMDSQSKFTLLGVSTKSLSFTPAFQIKAEHTYENGDLKGIYLDGDENQDLTPYIQGGKVAAFLQMRDETLPQIQKALDEFAFQVKDTFNAAYNQSASTALKNTFTAQNTYASTDAFTGTGDIQIKLVDPTTKEVSLAGTIDLSTVTTYADLATALDAIPGVSTSIVDDVLSIQADNASAGLLIAAEPGQGVVGNCGFSHHFGFQNLFQGTSVTDGLANILTLDETVTPLTLNTHELTPQTTSLRDGNANGVLTLKGLFESAHTFQAAGLMEERFESYQNYLASLFTQVSNISENAEKSQQYQEGLHSQAAESAKAAQGINMKEELVDVMQWNQYQMANLKVLAEANKMMERLLEMMR